MKVVIQDVDGEGLESFLGKPVALFAESIFIPALCPD